MKTLIVCVSVHHNNTAKVAETIGKVLGAELVKPKAVNVGSLGKYDLIGFGSGIYFRKHHQSLLKLAANLAQGARKVFIFSTKGVGPARLYHRALKKELVAKGCEVVGECSVRGYDTFGPLKWIGGINKGRPNERDLEKARAFAMNLGSAMGDQEQ